MEIKEITIHGGVGKNGEKEALSEVTLKMGEIISIVGPNTPSNPSPADGSTNVGVTTDMSWAGGDPDVGDTVTYDVYFGTSSTPSKISDNQSGTTYDTGTMNYNTVYYWRIVAWDNHGASTNGPGLYFTTLGTTNNPPSKPSKPEGQIEGKPGVEYTYATSTTDPDGDQVYYWWDWGDGNNSGWLGPYGSGVTAGVTYKWSIKDSYSVKVKVKDTFGAESPWSDPLPITMPYSFNRPLLQLLDWLFQRFPHAFPILRQLLGY